jgi:Arc/MetJ-type ribon-helix-helix transcriptional regulator
MTKKIAISLPDETLERARAAVERGKAANVSNYVASLIDQASATETFAEMVADWLRESGAAEENIRAAERQVLRDFETAGLVPKDGHRGKTARKTA